jgi:hypothetical protein
VQKVLSVLQYSCIGIRTSKLNFYSLSLGVVSWLLTAVTWDILPASSVTSPIEEQQCSSKRSKL